MSSMNKFLYPASSLFLSSLFTILMTGCSSAPLTDASKVSVIGKTVPSSCKRVGDVRAKNITYNKAVEDLKVMAYGLEAQFVQITGDIEETFSSTLEGVAYNCD